MVNTELGFDLDIVVISVLAGVAGGCLSILVGWVGEYWKVVHKKGR